MAFASADRVKETTTSTGTGTVSLDGAVSGFQTFVAGIGDANTCHYAIVHQSAAEWEVGLGTVTDASPDTLARTAVYASSSGTSAVNFSAGTKDVFVTFPANEAAKLPTYAVGPASATDNAIARFDGTTGKLVQDSGVTITDAGDLYLGATAHGWGDYRLIALDSEDGCAIDLREGGLEALSVWTEPSAVYVTAFGKDLRLESSTDAVLVYGSGGITLNADVTNVNGTLRLSGSTSGYVGLAPAAAAGSTTYTLPSADGSDGQFLKTNGSGTLSWATASGGGGGLSLAEARKVASLRL